MRGTLRAEEGPSHLLSSDDEGLSKAMGSSKKDPNFINTLANKRLSFIINNAFQSRIIDFLITNVRHAKHEVPEIQEITKNTKHRLITKITMVRIELSDDTVYGHIHSR